MPDLQKLFMEIESLHTWEPAIDPAQIDQVQMRHGFELPRDLCEFYKRYRSVRLFVGEYGTIYRFVPIDQIHPTRLDIYGKDTADWGPDSWFTVCDVQDGNYIAIDVGSRYGDRCNYIDCFHETFAEPGESRIISLSFTELLTCALDSHGKLFFLQDGFTDYGDGRPLTVENASLRIANPEAPEKGWLVKFTLRDNKKRYHKFFADKDFGGESKSLEAVRQFIQTAKNESSGSAA